MTNFVLKDLPVDLTELCIALEAETSDFRWFLDVSTGDVLLVTNEFDPAEHQGVTVTEIETDPVRFRRVPAGSVDDALGDMKAFVASLTDVMLRESLTLALEAPRPERRFRSVLGWVPGLQEQWHGFRQRRSEARATAWLESLGFTVRQSSRLTAVAQTST